MTPERPARFRKPIGLATALALAALALLAATVLAAEGSISIVQKTFSPADITVNVGDTVVWTVTEAIADPHSVTSGSSKDATPGSAFDSKISLKVNGDNFKHTFDAVGVYSYFCAVHPDTMSGRVTVVAAGASGAPAEGGSERTPVDSTTKLIAAGILGGAILILLGWAWAYRRMNRV